MLGQRDSLFGRKHPGERIGVTNQRNVIAYHTGRQSSTCPLAAQTLQRVSIAFCSSLSIGHLVAIF